MKTWLVLATLAACGDRADAGVPALGSADRLDLVQKQGFGQLRCNGTVFEIHLDLTRATWDSTLCDDKGKPVHKHGTLAEADRKAVDAAYAKLSSRRGTCGNDGGALTMTVHDRKGGSSVFVDENWGCAKPEPAMLDGLKQLAAVIAAFALI
jgi:hypothetical protein